jgi:hypothetical protein
MPLVEVVSHCWAKELPQYAQALVYQASSLVLHKPKVQVCLSVCYCKEDENAMKALKWVVPLLYEARISVTLQPLERNQIGRRSIGRNAAAKNCIGDVVWFADVDQVFRDGIFDRLIEMEWPEDAAMVHPEVIKIHKDHVIGDRRMQAVNANDLEPIDVDPSEFVEKRYNRAIGGVQIVRGDFAREHGYLDGVDKWQKPTDVPFGDFRDDIAYRKFCLGHGKIVGVDLPGMFRMRHTATTYQ